MDRTPRGRARALRLSLVVLAFLSFACGEQKPVTAVELAVDGSAGDAGTDASDDTCQNDQQCSDGRFCNGIERCVPGAEDADERGCVTVGSRCDAGRTCDEAARDCVPCPSNSDVDRDGVPAEACGGRDCDDNDPNRFPGNAELCDDGHDEDCDLSTPGTLDLDNDGHVDARCANEGGAQGDDCNDANNQQHPGQAEVCNGLDDDCDGQEDEGLLQSFYPDLDGDERGDMQPDGGTSEAEEACQNAARLAEELDDCDPTDPTRHFKQAEFCDDKDNDCDGVVDENPSAVLWYPDLDGDGFGDPNGRTEFSCFAPGTNWSILGRDCDDSDPYVSPIAPEICDGKDNNCNGLADYRLARGNYEDDDGDRVPDADCDAEQADCDDRDLSTYPGAPELCDGRDNDCDGRLDVGTSRVNWFVDGDRDGFGKSTEALESCEPVVGRVLRGGDCADFDAARNPGRLDDCSGVAGVDDDCDGQTDESALPRAYFRDSDSDGTGAGEPTISCAAPTGYVAEGGDCASEDSQVGPLSAEACGDGVDNDCDGRNDCDDADCFAMPSCSVTATLSPLSGANQTATLGKTLDAPIRVRLRDLTGTNLSGRPVTLTPVAGSGASPAGSTTNTDAGGIATFVVRAGRRTGMDYVRISAPGARTLEVALTVNEPARGEVLSLVNADKVLGAGLTAGSTAVATWARPGRLSSVAAARDGTLYLSDESERIYRLTVNGVLEHFAGDGSLTFADNVDAARASIAARALLLDEDDVTGPKLYIADYGFGRVRVIDLRTNLVSTVAGGGNAPAPDYGDGQAATAAQLRAPNDLALIGRTLYVADQGIEQLRKIDLDTGLISRVPMNVDDALQICPCTYGCTLAAGPVGDLFLAAFAVGDDVGDPGGACSTDRAMAVARIASDGTVRHVAGRYQGSAADGTSALALALPYTVSMAFDEAGHLYIAGASRVRRVDSVTTRVSSVLGDGAAGTSGDYGEGVARLQEPSDVTFWNGHLLVTDAPAGALRAVWDVGLDASTEVTGTLENPAQMRSQILTPGSTATLRIRDAQGSVLSGVPVLFRAISPGGYVSTPRVLSDAQGASSAALWPGRALADYAFEVEVTDIHGRAVVPATRIDVTGTAPPPGTVLPVVNAAHTPPSVRPGRFVTGLPGPALGARVNPPSSIALASDGTLYVATNGEAAIYKVTPSGVMSRFAGSGNGTQGGSGNGGPAENAELMPPLLLALDEPNRALFVAEAGANRIRVISLDGTPIIDMFTTGIQNMTGLTVDGAGDLYVAKTYEGGGDGLRRIDRDTRAMDIVLAAGPAVSGETRYWQCASQQCGVAVDDQDRIVLSALLSGPNYGLGGIPSGQGIARFTPTAGPTLEHVAGSNWMPGSIGGDGEVASISLGEGRGIATLGDDVYFGEAQGRVRRIRTGRITTLMAGTRDDDFGQATVTRVGDPASLAVSPDGHLFVADSRSLRMIWAPP